MAHNANSTESDDVLPPGTVHLLHTSNELGQDQEIILAPKRSTGPNDSLNWSRGQKMIQLFLVYLYTFSTGVAGTSTYSVLTDISNDTGITIAQLVLGTGFIFSPGWLWTAWISSFPQWAAARILFGVFVAPVEVLPEMRTHIGGYILVLNANNYVAPLIVGFMNKSIGWRWVQYWGSEETPAGEIHHAITIELQGSMYKIQSFWQKMALFKPAGFSAKQMLTTVYRPILILFDLPNVSWAVLNIAFAAVCSNTACGYAVYNATASAFLSAPLYNFTSSQVGLTYLALLAGFIVGGTISGPFADWYTLKLARKNGGLRKPEQHLWALTLYSILVPLGLFLWGLGAAYGWHFGILILGGFLCSLCSISGGISIAYKVDCLKEIAGESIVSMILVRNTLAFAFNYAITPWIEAAGVRDTFIAVAVPALTTGFTFLLAIWKGKYFRTRSAERYWRYAAAQVVNH
ncbi:major facilitator superfamily domain-containing protein [Ilyonectria destructans]|nr:major facilitator superfamily domain-containing protein [Ilyonectria destructans]